MKRPSKIILASGSVQRKNLLNQLGFKFDIQTADVEEISKIKTTCSALVKENALLKAEAVAGRVSSGIVIGADTVVYIGNKKLILKPRSYKEAKKNLKELFSKPHWVYTGVAVVNASSGRTKVDYEKTKIFMTKLTDKEIDQYHKRVNPFDKAGGFDIEGLGSIFIRRIEGCYSNVIGLPIAKCTSMLKTFGVSILSVFMMMTFFGLYNRI